MERTEIIKALECCSSATDGHCSNCPYIDNEMGCSIRLHKSALTLIKKLTEENERLTKANEVYAELEQGCLVTGVKKVQSDTVREIFKEIYSSLDYIEEQMEPEEIPECFFSVREDINALKEKFESEGAEK